MKKELSIIVLIFLGSTLNLSAQIFSCRSAGSASVQLANGQVVVPFQAPLGNFDVSVTAPVGGSVYSIWVNGAVAAITNIANAGWTNVTLPGTPNLIGTTFDIKVVVGGAAPATLLTFTLSSNAVLQDSYPITSVEQELTRLFPSLTSTEFGIQVNSSIINGYSNLGSLYTHIFLDQFGNTLLGAIPQGISNRQYIVHIIYFTNGAIPSQISYSVRQTKGSFNPSLVFNNAGRLGGFSFQSTGSTPPVPINYVWYHQEFLLRTATDDAEIEVYRNVTTQQSPFDIQTTLIAKHTINMSPIYHGSFDIGLLRTNLENPDYTLVDLPGSTTGEKTVKKSNSGPSGVVTAMATFYFSPLYFVRWLRDNAKSATSTSKKNLPKYKIYSRSLLDDHGLFERIYPTVGVALNDKAFQNLFVGVNWEIARGGSFFAGWHFGRVNTFTPTQTSSTPNFQFGTTAITQQAFDLARDQQWQTDFAIGANLDITVITNLFKSNSN